MNIRVFLKPDGTKYVDIPMPQSVTIGHVANVLQFEGWLIHEYGIIPRDSVYMIATTSPVEPPKPNLSIFPGGNGNKPDNPA